MIHYQHFCVGRISLPRPPAPVFAVHRISCQAPVSIGDRCHSSTWLGDFNMSWFGKETRCYGLDINH